jgi:NADH dehydrogenase FAD-containing subunit
MLVHSGSVILPELGESLGRYTQKVLARRGVEVRLNTRVKSMTENRVSLSMVLQFHPALWCGLPEQCPIL